MLILLNAMKYSIEYLNYFGLDQIIDGTTIRDAQRMTCMAAAQLHIIILCLTSERSVANESSVDNAFCDKLLY